MLAACAELSLFGSRHFGHGGHVSISKAILFFTLKHFNRDTLRQRMNRRSDRGLESDRLRPLAKPVEPQLGDAPFLRQGGTPYLEFHHIVQLADGGEDTAENAVAAGQNCHHQAHSCAPAQELPSGPQASSQARIYAPSV
ncbi:HNH endonuclease [Paraburkholderia sp. A3BS-1L]|uniref:HNH endonuclease n=1 Tax=Paraburkholderia sp. A3BS-1L TaxID=3028375 RepID=UPI003DAA326A